MKIDRPKIPINFGELTRTTYEDRLEIYDKVNKCESYVELSEVILSLADEDGMIQGRTRKFSAENMAISCKNFSMSFPNALTREFGIRQQAMYIAFYHD